MINNSLSTARSLKLRILSGSAEQTEALGESLGRRLRGGEVIDLVSDLGGGKTTFTRGLVRGAGSSNHVSSPTFTMGKIYDTPSLRINHFDFYRLSEAGHMADELAEIIADDQNVVLIEWSDIMRHVLPERRLTITLTQTGDETRELNLLFPVEYAYMFQEEPTDNSSEMGKNP